MFNVHFELAKTITELLFTLYSLRLRFQSCLSLTRRLQYTIPQSIRKTYPHRLRFHAYIHIGNQSAEIIAGPECIGGFENIRSTDLHRTILVQHLLLNTYIHTAHGLYFPGRAKT